MSNASSKTGRWIAAGLATLMLAAVFYNVVKDNMPKGDVRQIEGYTPWSKETLAIAETIPVQNGGRVKPLSSYAGFTMLGLHGARSMKVKDADGKNVSLLPTAWMMDALFRPRLAIKEPTFRVDNSSVLEAIGVKPRGKRDRYSYEDISTGREKLYQLAKSYRDIKQEKRDTVQEQILALDANVSEYEGLIGYFGFARNGVVLHGTGKEGAADQHSNLSVVMQAAPQIREAATQAGASGQQPDHHIQILMEQIQDAANFAKNGLVLLPPSDPKVITWQSAGDVIWKTIVDPNANAALAISDIKALEQTARALGSSEDAFRKELTTLRDDLATRAKARGEYKHIALEASFYRMNWFLNAMVLFIIGSICALAMWTMGQSKSGRVLSWITFGFTASGFVLCVIAIVQRCIIMNRPPVGNLYDTIIFIAPVVVLLSLIIEAMTRRRFALGIAPITGMLLIILSRRFELGDARDYMDPLIAVLKSNYWLTTHVITITLGYAAGLLSAFLAFVYLIVRGLRLLDDDRDARRFFTRAVYGMICLTLFLALVGTVLGGIWANDSWGRFWGWDPKENGALLIVLWTLAILHARLGGFIKEWGLHLAAVFTGAIVTFSWWHVNFLNTGLHSYGFTSAKGSLWMFYGILLVTLVFGSVVCLIDKTSKIKPSQSLPRKDDRDVSAMMVKMNKSGDNLPMR
jgi:ABC-type transport system involved in cytochrome c biogenesis permease subunit